MVCSVGCFDVGFGTIFLMYVQIVFFSVKEVEWPLLRKIAAPSVYHVCFLNVKTMQRSGTEAIRIKSKIFSKGKNMIFLYVVLCVFLCHIFMNCRIKIIFFSICFSLLHKRIINYYINKLCPPCC